jgi:hypothetical protein
MREDFSAHSVQYYEQKSNWHILLIHDRIRPIRLIHAKPR